MQTETPVFSVNDMLRIVGLTILSVEHSDINSFWQRGSATPEAQAVLDGWNSLPDSRNPNDPSDYKLWHLWQAGQKAKELVSCKSLTDA